MDPCAARAIRSEHYGGITSVAHQYYDAEIVVKAVCADGWGIVWQLNTLEYHLEKGSNWLVLPKDKPVTLRVVRRICQITGWTPEEFEARYNEMSGHVQ